VKCGWGVLKHGGSAAVVPGIQQLLVEPSDSRLISALIHTQESNERSRFSGLGRRSGNMEEAGGIVKVKPCLLVAMPLVSLTLFADTLGFVEQKFSHLNFEKAKWSRSVQLPCYTYTATENGATVDVLRMGTSNLVPFKAEKGLKVTVCGDTAAFDEGFEASAPSLAKTHP
jgi:hypothetical protein